MILMTALALGAVSSWAWARYISRIITRTAFQAAIFDGAIILPSILVKQIWALAASDFRVLLCYLAGSMLGTYLAVRYDTSPQLPRP